ncbi:hypothetical protein [Aquibacillus sediminis]|uniref:hypothetical protein n=1 Tax=Aquibacillus sediminis TaxID=2574734 RepID=UPI001108BE5C|nr:hypothetical protein [Aquibacillus sediminis]
MGMIDNNVSKLMVNHVKPILIYSKKGKVVEAYGCDHGQLFCTTYFLFLGKDQDCITLRLLVPMSICGYQFFKPSESTITISKTCLMGIQNLSSVGIHSNLIIRYPFSDCLKGEFSISEGYSETTIWQSNVKYPFKGNATIVYRNGTDPFIYVALYSLNNKLKTLYKVYKNVPFSFDFTKKSKIVVSKNDLDKKITGDFRFDLSGELKEKIHLNSAENQLY